MLLTIFGIACNKDLSRSVKEEEKPQVNILVGLVDSLDNGDDDDDDGDDDDDDGDDDDGDGDDGDGGNNTGGNEGNGSGNEEEQITETEKNEHSVYTFLGVSGLYFGCSTIFITDKDKLELIFGTSMTTNLNFTRQEFEELIHPGERRYGSLGAYTSFPERFADKVEISYTDKQGRRWCSTQITEKKNNDGVETTVKVDQEKGEFIIEDAHKVEIDAETEGYRLKGKFECTLYEVNGKAKRKIKGDFTGIVAPK